MGIPSRSLAPRAPLTPAARAFASARTKASSRREKNAVGEFQNMCRRAGVAEPVAEFRFHPVRMWRFDYAWPQYKIALEVQGGAWGGGRHTRGAGFTGDLEKLTAAAKLGWRILYTVPSQLLRAETVDDVRGAVLTHFMRHF